MIKHIVVWKLNEQEDITVRKEAAENIVKTLVALKDKIPAIVEIEAGINFNESDAAFDVSLYSVFNSVDDLQTYQKHPDHVKAAAFIRQLVAERVVVDYEI